MNPRKMFERPEGSRHPRPALGILIIVASFALGGYLWKQSLQGLQEDRIAYLEKLPDRLGPETAPLKFLAISRDEGTVKARLKLYDLSGREVAAIERSWPGSELYVDMLLLPFSSVSPRASRPDSWIALPYRVFTDKLPASSGTILAEDYDSGGFPEILRGAAWTAKEEKSISEAYAAARRLASHGLPADSKPGSYGSAIHRTAKAPSFEPGVVYKVVCRVEGGVEVVEE